MECFMMDSSVIDKAAREYHKKGYCILEGLLKGEMLDNARKAARDLKNTACTLSNFDLEKMAVRVNGESKEDFRFEAAYDKNGAESGTALRVVSNIHLYEPFFEQLREQIGLPTIAQKLLNSDSPAFINSMMFWKSHRAKSHQPWHQDQHAAPPNYNKQFVTNVNIWIALENATIDNGCLWFIERESDQRYIEHAVSLDPLDGGRLAMAMTAEQLAAAQPVLVSAGSAVAFDILTPHASYENKSNQSRPALAYIYGLPRKA
jgi:ectoine hydroxylase-related dioxygenase (phytanoyl-CoA dioxygenase family)